MDQRRKLVEDTIRRRGWNESVIQELMAKCGTERGAIYADKAAIIQKLVEDEAGTLDERRAIFLAGVRELREAAATGGAFAPAVRLMDIEGRVLGLDRVPLPEVEEPPGESLDTSLETVLREVRRMRRQAQRGASYIAADKLLQREHALIDSIRVRDEAERSARMEHLDEGALVDMVIGGLRDLPEVLRQKLRNALGQ